MRQKVIVWGMGKYYQTREKWLDDYEILAYVNDDEACKENIFRNKPVIRSKQILEYPFDELVIAVGNESLIEKSLYSLEIPKEKIKRLTHKEKFANFDSQRRKIRTFFYNHPNFGDYLNAYLMDDLFKVNIELAKVDSAEFVAIGSLLDMFLLHSKVKKGSLEVCPRKDLSRIVDVWGTGFMYDEMDNEFIYNMRIHALRGEKTRQKVEKYLGYPIDCPLADPGLLVSLRYSGNSEKKYEIGIIPHYEDYNESVIKQLAEQNKASLVIDITDSPTMVIEQILKCETIVSTSLHGLIIADSFGIPNRWCVCSKNIHGDNFKFRDYYSSYGIEVVPIDLRVEQPKKEDIISGYQIDYGVVKRKQKELLESFPYKETCKLRGNENESN